MKVSLKITSFLLIIALCTSLCIGLSACTSANAYDPYAQTSTLPHLPTYGTADGSQISATIMPTAPQGTVPPTTSVMVPEPETISIHNLNGPYTAYLNRVQTTIGDMPLEYGWVYHDGRIFLREYEGEYPLGTIFGSDSYIYASASSMVSVYYYLIDVQTGAVFDPLAGLETDIREHISDIVFSADGSYALVFSHANTVATLLERSTGQYISLPVAEDIYSVFGSFIADAHILLTSCFQNANGEFRYTFTHYNISTEEITTISGEYQNTDSNSSNFIRFSDNGMLYTYDNQHLVIIDPLSWESTVYPLADVIYVSYYTKNTYIITTESCRYLLHKNGTYQLIDAS